MGEITVLDRVTKNKISILVNNETEIKNVMTGYNIYATNFNEQKMNIEELPKTYPVIISKGDDNNWWYVPVNTDAEHIAYDTLKTLVKYEDLYCLNDIELPEYEANEMIWCNNMLYTIVKDKITLISVKEINANAVTHITGAANIYKVEKLDKYIENLNNLKPEEHMTSALRRAMHLNKRRILFNIEEYKNEERHLLEEYSRNVNKRIEASLSIEGINIDKQIEKTKNTISKLKEIEDIKSIMYCADKIQIVTNTIYFRSPDTGSRYKLGEMEINIPYKISEEISFKNLYKTRDGYEYDMNAPHVFASGRACFGTFAAQIAQYRANNEYDMLALTLLTFLKTVDEYDPAGMYARCWEEVDENNNVIGEPLTKDDIDEGKAIECEICGTYHREDEMYYCEDCESYVCPNCWDREFDVCENCAEHYIETIHGNYIRDNSSSIIELFNGEYTTEYEINNYNDVHKCEECGEYYREEDMRQLVDRDGWYCNTCATEIEKEEEDNVFDI